MTFFPFKTAPDGSILMGMGDTASLDAFGRQRVSQPHSILSLKQVTANQSIYFSNLTANGGTIVYTAARSSSYLNTTTASGSRAVRQTKQYAHYQAGKSMQILLTGRFGAGQANCKQRMGFFDDNNGLFFELRGSNSSTEFGIVVRSDISGSPNDTFVARSDWNVDKLDGNGPSGIILDITKAQIFCIDFQWLGVGRVRYGICIDGKGIIVHEANHANSLSSVYMRTPSLPVRYEVVNSAITAGSTQMEQICCCVNLEDAYNPVVYSRSAGILGNAGKVIGGHSGGADRPRPIMSLRLGSANPRGSIFLRDIKVLIQTAGVNMSWELLLNATIAYSVIPVWAAVANSFVEFDITGNVPGSAGGEVSGGTVLASGLIANEASETFIEIRDIVTIASDISGTSDILTLVGTKFNTGNDTVNACMTWLELE